MPHQRRLPSLLLGALLLVPVLGPVVARAASPTPAQLVALETALNSGDDSALSSLLIQGPGLNPDDVKRRRQLLRQQFPDLRWEVRNGPPLRDGQSSVTLKVSGTREQGGSIYRLDAEQRLSLQTDGQRFVGQTIWREQSLLRSGENSPPITLLIPDAVLTGQRYDVDVIFDEPLEGALVAGGIQAITPEQVNAMESPQLELAALGGGGLFKVVQAPQTPGFQTWAVLLVHPKGVVSATKRVRVVSDRPALDP
ncbi:MAG: hypothetical protein FJ083_05075 [Cyanobacteria bacterium K_Offshore_surface_m2_239]|nr:hypothetical protein [Cyanobacteria bacterium K_Offshore_surface_m2_239]